MDDGFDNSWTGATVQKSKGNKFAVEYSAFVDDKVRARVVRVVRVVRVRANPNPNPNPNLLGLGLILTLTLTRVRR